MTHSESWQQNFELLKAYIEEHHHLPDKKKVENRGLLSWAKYQRKRIKAGALDEKRKRLFEEDRMVGCATLRRAAAASDQQSPEGCGKRPVSGLGL